MSTNREDEIRAKVLADYEAVLGKEILVSELTGYKDDTQEDFILNPPVKCRVMTTKRMDLFHAVDHWMDPYWNLELVHPDPRLEGYTSLWMYGTSYNYDTLASDPARCELVA
jgi:hypothetical protein